MKESQSILGIVTINEKGQVVIPADVRASLDLSAGDKLLVMAHPGKDGLFLVKPDSLETLAKQMLAQVSDARDTILKDADGIE